MAQANAQDVQDIAPAGFERLKAGIRVHRMDNCITNQAGGSYLSPLGSKISIFDYIEEGFPNIKKSPIDTK